MKSFTTVEFWRSYARLPPPIKLEAKKAYRLWQTDSHHPSLHFKKIKQKNLWTVRITLDYRALAIKKENSYYWIWIGSHKEYDRLLK